MSFAKTVYSISCGATCENDALPYLCSSLSRGAMRGQWFSLVDLPLGCWKDPVLSAVIDSNPANALIWLAAQGLSHVLVLQSAVTDEQLSALGLKGLQFLASYVERCSHAGGRLLEGRIASLLVQAVEEQAHHFSHSQSGLSGASDEHVRNQLCLFAVRNQEPYPQWLHADARTAIESISAAQVFPGIDYLGRALARQEDLGVKIVADLVAYGFSDLTAGLKRSAIPLLAVANMASIADVGPDLVHSVDDFVSEGKVLACSQSFLHRYVHQSRHFDCDGKLIDEVRRSPKEVSALVFMVLSSSQYALQACGPFASDSEEIHSLFEAAADLYEFGDGMGLNEDSLLRCLNKRVFASEIASSIGRLSQTENLCVKRFTEVFKNWLVRTSATTDAGWMAYVLSAMEQKGHIKLDASKTSNRVRRELARISASLSSGF